MRKPGKPLKTLGRQRVEPLPTASPVASSAELGGRGGYRIEQRALVREAALLDDAPAGGVRLVVHHLKPVALEVVERQHR